MGQFDKLNRRASASASDLVAMGEALDASTLLESAALDEMRQTIDAKKQIAAIAKEMGKQLDRVSDELAAMRRETREMRSSVVDAADTVYSAIDKRADDTLKYIEFQAQSTIDTTNEHAVKSSETLERTRKSVLSTVLGVTVVSCVVLLIAVYLALGELYMRMEHGWREFGWVPAAIVLAIAVIEGAYIMLKR